MEEFKGIKPFVIGQGTWDHHKINQMPSKDWTVLCLGKWTFVCCLSIEKKDLIPLIKDFNYKEVQ